MAATVIAGDSYLVALWLLEVLAPYLDLSTLAGSSCGCIMMRLLPACRVSNTALSALLALLWVSRPSLAPACGIVGLATVEVPGQLISSTIDVVAVGVVVVTFALVALAAFLNQMMMSSLLGPMS